MSSSNVVLTDHVFFMDNVANHSAREEADVGVQENSNMKYKNKDAVRFLYLIN